MKTANNKIPVSSIFNDSKGLYGTTVCRCLQSVGLIIPRANAFRVTWSERVRHRNVLTEIAWEDAVQGQGMAMSTVLSKKKTGKCCLWATCFTNSDISACSVSLVFLGHDPLKIANINPQQEATLSLWKKISSSRERRKWSLGLGQHVKGTSSNVRVTLAQEIRTQPQVSLVPSLKSSKSREQFLLRLTLCYPIYD